MMKYSDFYTKIKNIIFAFLILIPVQFSNAGEAEVKTFVEDVASQIMKIVTDHHTSDDTKADHLLTVIKTNFDTHWMGKFVLGREYRQLPTERQKKYDDLYNSYLKNTYFPILMKYNNPSYKITKIIKTDSNLYSVYVTITTPSTNPIDLSYTVKYKDSKYYLLDMSVEGVSTIFTQKSEFDSVIQQGGVDTLFQKLATTTRSKS